MFKYNPQLTIGLGSKNTRKNQAVKNICESLFFDREILILNLDVDSGVSHTPHGRETYQGAKNRALGCKKISNVDFYVGIESGLVQRNGKTFEETWSYIVDTHSSKNSVGYSSGLLVPNYILKKMKKSQLSHYQIMTLIEKEKAAEQSETWGIYSGHILKRKDSLKEAVRNAFIPLIAKSNGLYLHQK